MNKDFEYLKHFPFLSNLQSVTTILNVTLDKLDTTNIYDAIFTDIYKELKIIINQDIINYEKIFEKNSYYYEVVKFYLTIIILKYLDNIAITRIWINRFLKKIEFNINQLLKDDSLDKIDLFLDLFRLLENDNHFKLKRVDVDYNNSAFGIHMNTYLDVAANVDNTDPERYQILKLVNTTLHKGYVIIAFNDYEFLTCFIGKFAKDRIFELYNNVDNSQKSVTKKIIFIVERLKSLIIESEKVSINIKKHYVDKELLYERERITNVERSNVIIKELEELQTDDIKIKTFPPCLNFIFKKLFIQKIPLSHNENILLCSYLNKKQFVKDHILKIFSKAINYDKGTTDYQVTFLINKDLMPMNCSSLLTEGICKKELDTTNQCYRLKNPLSFK